MRRIAVAEKHLLLHLRGRVRLHQDVHGPVGLVLTEALQPGDGDVLHSFSGGQLRARRECPVGEQGEPHPFHVSGEPPPSQRLGQRVSDAELGPKAVPQPYPTELSAPFNARSSPGAHSV